MIAIVDTLKRFLGRFKRQDFEFVLDNWSVLRSRNTDIPAVGRAKAKLISELLERIKVNTAVNCFMYNSVLNVYTRRIYGHTGLRSHFM